MPLSATPQSVSQIPENGGYARIADDLHLFRVPKHRFRVGNTFGLIHQGRSILIDAVHAANRPNIDKVLADYPPAALLITHSDLLNQAWGKPTDLSTWLGGAPVLIHSMDIGRHAGLHPLETNGPVLHDLEMDFYHVPGHTPGSAAYLYQPGGYLFTGDIIIGNNYEKAGQDWTHGPIAERDWPGFTQGIGALPATGVEHIFPLHGQFSSGPATLADLREAGVDREKLMRE